VDELLTITDAARKAGVDRNAVARWVKAGLLAGKRKKVGNLIATMVSVDDVRRVAKDHRPGRPRKTTEGGK
jgi:predicted site-specific integrase-resolvase